MKRFAFSLGLIAAFLGVTGCSGSNASDDDGSEGALEQEGASRHDLKSYAFVYGFVAVNDDAAKLFDKIKTSGGKTLGKTVYAGLTWKDLGVDGDSDQSVFGINCAMDEGSGTFSMNSCMFTGIVKAEATKNLPANPAPVKVTVGGRVAKTMADVFGATSVAGIQCTAAAGQTPASCSLPVLLAGDAVQTMDKLFQDVDKPEDRASLDKIVDIFIDQ